MRPPLVLLLVVAGACSNAAVRPDAGVPDLARADKPHAPDRTAAADSSPPDHARPDGAFTLGGGCASDLDCSAGLACLGDWPGGFCTRSCTGDAECGAPGAKQAVSSCHEGRCHPRCDPRAAFSSCREGYVCRLSGAKAVCVPDCRVAATCASGWSCEKGSGLCYDPASGAVGAACGPTIGTCDGTPNGVCYSLGGFGPGFCTIPCSPFTKPCPLELKGSTCLLGSITAPYCGFICDPASPSCPHPGMSCTALGEVHVCLP